MNMLFLVVVTRSKEGVCLSLLFNSFTQCFSPLHYKGQTPLSRNMAALSPNTTHNHSSNNTPITLQQTTTPEY